MKNIKEFNKAIKTWFLENEIDHNTLDVYQMRFYKDLFSKAEIVKETEKAILVKCRYPFDEGYWIPKSVLIENWEEPSKRMINLAYHTYLWETADALLKADELSFSLGMETKEKTKKYIFMAKTKDLETSLKRNKISYLKKADFVKKLIY